MYNAIEDIKNGIYNIMWLRKVVEKLEVIVHVPQLHNLMNSD